MGGRIEVEPDDVAHPGSSPGQALVDKQRIARQLEGFKAMRLQPEGAPDAPDARGRDAAVPRHAARTPMRGIRWLTLSSVCTMMLSTLLSSILRGTPGRGSSGNPPRPCSTNWRHLPTVCGATCSRPATCCSDPPRSPAHDPRPQRQSLRRLAPLRIAFQNRGNLGRQLDPPPGGPSTSPCPRRYGSPTIYYT